MNGENMKTRKWLIILYLVCFAFVSIAVEYSHSKGIIYYTIDDFVVDPNGVLYLARWKVIEKHDGDTVEYIKSPVRSGCYLAFSPDGTLQIETATNTYLLNEDGESFTKTAYTGEGKNNSGKPNRERFTDVYGNTYQYKRGLLRKMRIVDQNGTIIYSEPFLNYLANRVIRVQIFALALAIILIVSKGRPILFVKVACRQLSDGHRMPLDHFDELVAKH